MELEYCAQTAWTVSESGITTGSSKKEKSVSKRNRPFKGRGVGKGVAYLENKVPCD